MRPRAPPRLQTNCGILHPTTCTTTILLAFRHLATNNKGKGGWALGGSGAAKKRQEECNASAATIITGEGTQNFRVPLNRQMGVVESLESVKHKANMMQGLADVTRHLPSVPKNNGELQALLKRCCFPKMKLDDGLVGSPHDHHASSPATTTNSSSSSSPPNDNDDAPDVRRKSFSLDFIHSHCVEGVDAVVEAAVSAEDGKRKKKDVAYPEGTVDPRSDDRLVKLLRRTIAQLLRERKTFFVGVPVVLKYCDEEAMRLLGTDRTLLQFVESHSAFEHKYHEDGRCPNAVKLHALNEMLEYIDRRLVNERDRDWVMLTRSELMLRAAFATLVDGGWIETLTEGYDEPSIAEAAGSATSFHWAKQEQVSMRKTILFQKRVDAISRSWRFGSAAFIQKHRDEQLFMEVRKDPPSVTVSRAEIALDVLKERGINDRNDLKRMIPRILLAQRLDELRDPAVRDLIRRFEGFHLAFLKSSATKKCL